LDVEYPSETSFFRSKIIKGMSSYEFLVRYISDERFKDVTQRAQKMLGSVKRMGGSIEIYIGKLIIWAAKTVKENRESFTDQTIIDQFIDEHFIVYTHELLHRMWHWESTFEENRRRSRKRAQKREERAVKELALWIRNIMYVKPPYADMVWDKFCKRYSH